MPIETTDLLYPTLPLRDVVAFPGMKLPLLVGRPGSLRAVERAVLVQRGVLLVAQKAAALEDPREEDLYSVGTLANVLERVAAPNGMMKLIVEGTCRARVHHFAKDGDFLQAAIELIEDQEGDTDELVRLSDALFRRSLEFVEQFERDQAPTLANRLTERLTSPDVDRHVARMQELLEADVPTSNERLQQLEGLRA